MRCLCPAKFIDLKYIGMCDFQKLVFNEHGYVVRCNYCSHYQLGFGTAMLTLSQADFRSFIQLIEEKIFSVTENDTAIHEEIKSVVIPTPYTGMCLFVTKLNYSIYIQCLTMLIMK